MVCTVGMHTAFNLLICQLLLFSLSGILEHIAMVKANLNRSMWEQGNYTIIKVVAACLKNFSYPDLVLQKYETTDIFNQVCYTFKHVDIFYLQGTDSVQIK